MIRGTAASKDATSVDVAARFMTTISTSIGPFETRTWFKDARLEKADGAWQLVVGSTFIGDWIRSRFRPALERARDATGLEAVPDVVVRSRL